MERERDASSSAQKPSALLGLLGILAFAFGVWALSKLGTPNNKSGETVHPQDTPKDKNVGSGAPLGGMLVAKAPNNPDNPRERRRHKTPWWEAAAVIIAGGLLIVNCFITLATWNSASWVKQQTKEYFAARRPRIWVKVPDTIQIEPGKPISPNIQIFNYGESPGITRARMRFEASAGLIEKFRYMLRNHADSFMVPVDQVGSFSSLIEPKQGKPFPIETPELVLGKSDLDKLGAGTIDIVIYGRIFYTDLDYRAFGNRTDQYNSIFCYYVMADAKTLSACPNRYNEYTNWAP